MKRTLVQWLSVLAAVTWLFVVTLNYYIVHKPFNAENALAIFDTMANVFIAALVYAIAASIGHRFTRAVAFASPLEAAVFRIGIGLGAISLATFALGLGSLLNRLLFWLLVLIVAFLLRSDLLAEWRNLRSIRVHIDSRFERALIIFIVITFAIPFVVALTPTLGWDSQLYHLLEGKVFIAQGRIGLPPDIPSFNYPSLVEMLYLTVMLLKDDGATACLHLGFLLLTIGALLSFSQRFFSVRVGWLASAILLAVPSYLYVAGLPYNDAALAFYAFTALYAVMVAQDKHETSWLVISGVCAGMAMGMKYTGLAIPIAVAGILLLNRRVPFKHWWWVFVPCALVAAPWYVRNWVWMGNPVYPFFFGGRYWDEFRSSAYSLFGTGLITQPWRILIAPWEATILGEEGKAMYEATIGPLVLAGLPLLFLVWRAKNFSSSMRKSARDVVVFVAILYLLWLAGMTISRSFVQARLLFPAFPALALLVALAFEHLPALDLPPFSLARFTRWVLGLVLGLTLLAQWTGFVALNPAPYLIGLESRDEFLAKRLSPGGYWQAVESLQKFPGARVLFLWEPRAYYAPDNVQVQPDEILDEFAHRRYLYHDAAGIAQSLRADGYTYILLNRWGMEFQLADRLAGLSVDDARIVKELLSRYTRQVYGNLPFDYSIDVDGGIRILGSANEPYAIYAIAVSSGQ